MQHCYLLLITNCVNHIFVLDAGDQQKWNRFTSETVSGGEDAHHHGMK